MTDTQDQWKARMLEIVRLQIAGQWPEAREAVELAKQAAPTEHHRSFATYRALEVELCSAEKIDLQRDYGILGAAYDALDAIPLCEDEDENRELDYLRATLRWTLLRMADALDVFDSPEEAHQLELEARRHVVEMGERWARPRVLGENGANLANVPKWQRPIVEHTIVAIAKLKAIHEIDPDIVKRPTEMVEILQREVSLSLSVDHESYEAMVAANLASEEDRCEFTRDFQSRLATWRTRPFAPELERLFEVCWSSGLTAEHHEAIRKEVSERIVRAFIKLFPAFVEHDGAGRPEAKARAGVALLAQFTEAVYQPLIRGLLDLSCHATGSPRSTNKMNVGKLVDTAMNLSAPTAPGLRAVAMRQLVIARNAAMHLSYDVTSSGEVTLWGGGGSDPSKKLGPLDLEALDAMITEARETCLTISLAFSLLIHPDIPHLGRSVDA